MTNPLPSGAGFVKEEQAAALAIGPHDALRVVLEGATVTIGHHPTRGRTIVVEPSAGLALVISDRLAPLDTEEASTPFERVSADPRAAHVSWTVDGRVRISVEFPGGGIQCVKADEDRAEAALDLLAEAAHGAA